MNVVTNAMKHFLLAFGVTEDNGLSPFAISNVHCRADLKKVIVQFFGAPKPDRRDQYPRKACLSSAETVNLNEEQLIIRRVKKCEAKNHITMPINHQSFNLNSQ